MANEFRVRKGLVVNGSGSVLLDIQGSQGQLFSVTDQLSGSLFSVSDASGIPVMEAFSDTSVRLGLYGAEAIIVSGSNARITGSLFGTSSWALNAITASNATTASFVPTSSLVGNFFVQGGNSFGAQAVLGTNDAQSLAIRTNGSTRIAVDSAGNVGIGTTAPGAFLLDVNGTARVTSTLSTLGQNIAQGIFFWNEGALGGTADGTTFSTFNQANARCLWFRGDPRFHFLSTPQSLYYFGARYGAGSSVWQLYNFMTLGMAGTETFGISSGTSTANVINIILPYNYTGGTTTLRGIYYNPTLTSMTGVTHRAIETVSGDVLFGTTSGNVGIGPGKTSPNARLDVSGSTILSGSLVVAPSGTPELQVASTGTTIGNIASDIHNVTGSLNVSGSLTVNGPITATTLVVQTITSSQSWITGSTKFGSINTNTHEFTGSVSISGSSVFGLNVNNNALYVSSSGQVGINNTLSASANNDVLVGLDINPTFSTGSFTGVTNTALRLTNGNLNITYPENIQSGIVLRGTSGAANIFNNIDFQHTGNSNILGRIGVNQQSGEMRFTANSGGYFQTFYSNGSEAMRISTSRNILIGTTTDSGFRLEVATSGTSGSFRSIGTSIVSGSLILTGSLSATGAVTASAAFISGSGTNRFTVIGSGSAQPIFTIQGSQGELFSITDSLSGSLFSVNDISGLPILEVFSNNTTLQGSYLAPSLNTTTRVATTNSGSFFIYGVPTSSYDGLFVDYTAKSGSDARVGQIMALWSGSSVNYTETTASQFGNTSALSLAAVISGSNMVVTGSVTAGSGWTIKAIIRSI